MTRRPQRPLGPSDLRAPTRSKHGATARALAAMLESQGGRCAICRRPISGQAAVVDHDHAKAASHPHPVGRGCDLCRRAILCGGCNTGLGAFRDDADAMRRAAAYVEAFR